MKKSITVLLLVIVACSARAQVKTVTTYLGSPTKRADHLYQSEYYQEAIKLYQRALTKHPEDARLKLQIAECYRKLNNPEQAAQWYSQVIYNEMVVTPEHQFHYAQALMSTGRVRQAEMWYARYYQNDTTNEQALHKLRSISQRASFYRDSLLYEVQPLRINSPVTDFAPAWYQEGLVFISARDTKLPIKQVFRWNETPYLEMFFTKIDSSGNANRPRLFGTGLNSAYHEGPAVFYDSSTRAIFTRNINQKKKKKATRTLGLFTAHQNGTGWSPPAPLSFNNPAYSVGHPAVSEDGKTLYFVSDMPGGLGGTDLYVSYQENGAWTEPENLGRPINTEGNEMFPFLHQGQTLYFSSDGHRGLGGLDLYKCEVGGSVVDNVGYPINSPYDDFSLVLNDEGKQGFFASNRGGQAGNDDLYRVDVNLQTLELLVVDKKTQEPLSDAEVILIGNGMLEAVALTDSAGLVRVDVNPYFSYLIDVEKEEYQGNAIILDSAALLTQSNGYQLVIPLQRETGTIDLTARLYNKLTDETLANTLVHLVNIATGDTISQVTNESGEIQAKVDNISSYQFSGEIDGSPWQYPIIEASALNARGKNQISIPINLHATTSPLRVVALDADTDQPIEWATVRLIEDGLQRALLRTNHQGTALFDADPSRSYLVSVEPLLHYDDVAIVMADEFEPGVEHRVKLRLQQAEGVVTIEAQLYDSLTKAPLANTLVRIKDEATGKATTVFSNEQGTIRMKVERGATYRVVGQAEAKKESGGTLVSIPKEAAAEILDRKIPVYQPQTYDGLLAEADQGSAKTRVEAIAEGEAVGEVDLKNATFVMINSHPNHNENNQRWIELGDGIYQLLNEGEDWYLKDDDNKKLLVDGALLTQDGWSAPGSERVLIENVYFAFDKYIISATAAAELDKIVALMQRQSSLKLEASTHTDIRGSKIYNRILSQKRAQAVLTYLVKQGVEEERIYLNFYGEDRPLQSCEKNGCTEEVHRMNRRAEFLLNFI